MLSGGDCNRQNILFIYEQPIDSKGNEELQLLPRVFKDLKESLYHKRTKDICLLNKVSLVVQSEGDATVVPFDCDEQCMASHRVTLSKMTRNYRMRSG